MTDEEKTRRRPFFKERFLLHLQQLEQEEILRKAQTQRAKELSKDIRGPYSHYFRYAVLYSLYTDIHGVRFLAEKRSVCEKILWGIILLINIILCFAMVFQTFATFEGTSIIVSFKTEETPIYDTDFPAVTICPSIDPVHRFINEDILNEKLKSTTKHLMTLSHFLHLLCIFEGKSEIPSEISYDSFLELIDEVKPSIDDVLLKCEIFGKKQNCSDLFNPIFTDEGLCFSFNIITREELFRNDVYHFKNYYKSRSANRPHGDINLETYPFRALFSGTTNGLRLVLKLKKTESNSSCNYIYDGYKVFLHDPFDVPILYRKYYLIPVNTHVSIAMEPQIVTVNPEISKMSLSKRKCYIDEEKQLTLFKKYSKRNCQLQCFADFIQKECNCVYFYLPRNNNTPVCGNEKYSCVKEVKKKLELFEAKSEIRKEVSGECVCKPLCVNLKYKTEVSQSEWEWTRFYGDMLAGENSQHKQQLNFSSDQLSFLNIYFKSSSVLPIEKHKWRGISDLLSNVGGYLSFFTGMSVISMLELIYFFTLRIFCNKILYGASLHH